MTLNVLKHILLSMQQVIDDFKSLLTDAEVFMVDKAAHLPQLERQDVVSPAVIKFLS